MGIATVGSKMGLEALGRSSEFQAAEGRGQHLQNGGSKGLSICAGKLPKAVRPGGFAQPREDGSNKGMVREVGREGLGRD